MLILFDAIVKCKCDLGLICRRNEIEGEISRRHGQDGHATFGGKILDYLKSGLICYFKCRNNYVF